jgi:hypothetical protein
MSVDPQAKEHIWSALTSLATAPIAERTFTGLAVLLQSQQLKQALAPWCVGGAWGRLLDAETERLGEATVQVFETEGLMARRGPGRPVLPVSPHRGRLDGSPTLIVIDEGWLALDRRVRQTAFGMAEDAAQEERQRHLRHPVARRHRGSDIAPAIIESCPTRIFLPNERAAEPQIAAIYERFGLNDRQIEILSRATPKRDYYCQSRRGNRLFELGLGGRAGLRRRLQGRSAPDRRAHRHMARRLRPNGCATAAAPGRSSFFPNQPDPPGNRPPCLEGPWRKPPSCAAPCWPAIVMIGTTAATPAHAQFGGIVYDPTNYAQNVLTAARSLQQINSQIQQIQQQATSLINEARNLASLPFSSHSSCSSRSGRRSSCLGRPSASPTMSGTTGVHRPLQGRAAHRHQRPDDRQCERALGGQRRRVPGSQRAGRRRRQYRGRAPRWTAWSRPASPRPALLSMRSRATSFSRCNRSSSPT